MSKQVKVEPLKDYSEMGARVILDAARRRKPARPQGASTGGIFKNPPAITYDQMRQVDNAMTELDALVRSNINRAGFLGPWAADLAAWKKFAGPYLAGFPWSFGPQFSSLWSADEIAQRTEDWRLKYESWKADYLKEIGPDGPKPFTPPPGTRPKIQEERKDEGKSETGSFIPWWGWLLIGGAVTGIGYGVYRMARSQYRDAQAKRAALEGVLPRLLPGGIGAAAATHATDPSPPRSLMDHVVGDPSRVYVTGMSIRREDLDEVLKLAGRR